MKQTHNLQPTTNNEKIEKGERSTARPCEKEHIVTDSVSAEADSSTKKSTPVSRLFSSLRGNKRD